MERERTEGEKKERAGRTVRKSNESEIKTVIVARHELFQKPILFTIDSLHKS